jgi:hypothetical protein
MISAAKSIQRVISRNTIIIVAPAAVRPLILCAGGFDDFISYYNPSRAGRSLHRITALL